MMRSILFLFFIYHVYTVECLLSNLTNVFHDLPEINEGESCIPGHMYKMSCNTCQCSDNSALVCTKMACLDKETMEKLKQKKKLSWQQGIRSRDRLPELDRKCIPGKTIRIGCKVCYCNHERKKICFREICRLKLTEEQMKDPEYFLSLLQTKEVTGLPSLPHMASECQRGKTYKIDCNICACLSNGNLMCTKRLCVTSEGIVKAAIFQHSGKSCKDGETVRLQCIKCDCVNGKTKCGAIMPRCKQPKVQLLSSISGNNVKLSLDATKDKCTPKMIYRVHCNTCHCQEDGQLRCTQKFCLNYSEAKKLKKQRLYLEKYGL